MSWPSTTYDGRLRARTMTYEERLRREHEQREVRRRERAKEYVEWISELRQWPDGDCELVLGSLGLVDP